MYQLRRIALVIFSAGWVVLVWGAVISVGRETLDLFRHFANGGAGWPSAATGTSFPVEEFSFQLAAWQFTVGCVWLVLVIIYWVLRATQRSELSSDSLVSERSSSGQGALWNWADWAWVACGVLMLVMVWLSRNGVAWASWYGLALIPAGYFAWRSRAIRQRRGDA